MPSIKHITKIFTQHFVQISVTFTFSPLPFLRIEILTTGIVNISDIKLLGMQVYANDVTKPSGNLTAPNNVTSYRSPTSSLDADDKNILDSSVINKYIKKKDILLVAWRRY